MLLFTLGSFHTSELVTGDMDWLHYEVTSWSLHICWEIRQLWFLNTSIFIQQLVQQVDHLCAGQVSQLPFVLLNSMTMYSLMENSVG